MCDLCTARAAHEGWIRESGVRRPAGCPQRRPEQRGSLLGPLPAATRARRPGGRLEEPSEPDWEEGVARARAARAARARRRRRREAPRDPRHVRAVPTTADVKVERALELFNDSEHARSIAGIMRSLGEPWVAAAPGCGRAEPGRHPGRVGALVVPLPRRSGRRRRGGRAARQGRGARPARGRAARLERPGIPGWSAGPRCRLTRRDLLRRPTGARGRAVRQARRLLQGRPEREGHHRPARGRRPPRRQRTRPRASSARFATGGARRSPGPPRRTHPASSGAPEGRRPRGRRVARKPRPGGRGRGRDRARRHRARRARRVHRRGHEQRGRVQGDPARHRARDASSGRPSSSS